MPRAGVKLPESYGVTRRYQVLRVCERMGWDIETVERMSPARVAEVVAYCGIREREEASQRAAELGVRL